VLVAGADSPTGLGVARALHAEGPTIVGMTTDPSASPCRSALWREVLPAGDGSETDWLAAMRTAASRYGRMVLIPVADEVVDLVARHSSALAAHFDFVLPGAGVVQTLLDKTEFHDWAVRQGFPVPHTEIVTDEAELAAALDRITYPAVIKPFERTPRWQVVSPRHKAYRLDSPSDLDRIGFRLFDVAPRYVLQQWIPGRDSDVWFCLTYRDREGRTLGQQVGRKLVQWPVGTGCTALATTGEDEELHVLTQKLLDAAGHVGVGSLEVKRSSADGRFYITEPTVGRPNLQSNLATAAGVNLTLLQYRDACGLPTGPVPAPRRALWVHETSLPRAVAVSIARRCLDVRAIVAGVHGSTARTAAFSAPRDTRPLRTELARLARKAVGVLVGRVGGTIRRVADR
jgi:predicted ATP-grasp superfamily ATP-dependent carboligase